MFKKTISKIGCTRHQIWPIQFVQILNIRPTHEIFYHVINLRMQKDKWWSDKQHENILEKVLWHWNYKKTHTKKKIILLLVLDWLELWSRWKGSKLRKYYVLTSDQINVRSGMRCRSRKQMKTYGELNARCRTPCWHGNDVAVKTIWKLKEFLVARGGGRGLVHGMASSM